MNRLGTGFVTALAVVLLTGSMSIFTVAEYERVIKLQLGQIVDVDYKPGLHFKVPFIHNVVRFDARIQTLDAEPERYLTLEKKNLLVDSFVKWRIADTRQFYTSMGGDIRRANLRLSQIVKDGLRAEFASRSVQDVISGERVKIMQTITVAANKQSKEFGIEIVDVRIKRIDLPREVSDSVFRRMEAERLRVAKDLRSQGAEAAERIRADADRQRTVLLAEAYKDSEKIRGEGDAKATEIYAKVFTKDADFFSFYRSLTAYRNSFKDRRDVIVLDADADFLKFFRQPKGE